MIHRSSIQCKAIRSLVLMAATLAAAGAALAATPDAEQVADQYATCGKPLLRESAARATEEFTEFGVTVQGERYVFKLEKRVSMTFEASEGKGPVAHVKVDRPVDGAFAEQAAWRERFLQDVATRGGIVMERNTQAAGVKVFTVNKNSLKGRYAGISTLIDPARSVIVQWDWDLSERYASAQDVKLVQSAVWAQLLPCLLKL
ncbi:MAG: hypothetical protein V4582_24015 [Pseudomonadota bacterium]